jgi:hypothetical protein
MAVTSSSLPRRRVILSSLALSLVVTSTASSASGRASLAALLSHLPAARLVGRHYLSLVPEERSAAALRRVLFDGADLEDGRPAGLERLRAHVHARRRQDFAAGDTLVVGGWLIARTEARLCALSVLA